MMTLSQSRLTESRIDVPLALSTGADCGAVGLKMIADYLGVANSIDQIQTFARAEADGGSITIGLVVAACRLNLSSYFYSLNPANEISASSALDFYTNFYGGAEAIAKKGSELLSEALSIGAVVNKSSITLNDILSHVSRDIVPLVLLDWNQVKGMSGYWGHFVPIVGYDQNHVFVHHSGPKNAKAFFPISKPVFELARKAPGTDEDVLFIGRKGLTKISISATPI